MALWDTGRRVSAFSDLRWNFSLLSTAFTDRDTTVEQHPHRIDIQGIFAPEHSLRDGFTTYSELSPAIGLFVAVAGPMRTHRHQLRASVEALRPHGFVVRGRHHSSGDAPRPSHPASYVRDDREAPLFSEAGWDESCARFGSAIKLDTCGTLARRANHVPRTKPCQSKLSEQSLRAKRSNLVAITPQTRIASSL
jgi:hypothetical protein